MLESLKALLGLSPKPKPAVLYLPTVREVVEERARHAARREATAARYSERRTRKATSRQGS